MQLLGLIMLALAFWPLSRARRWWAAAPAPAAPAPTAGRGAAREPG